MAGHFGTALPLGVKTGATDDEVLVTEPAPTACPFLIPATWPAGAFTNWRSPASLR